MANRPFKGKPSIPNFIEDQSFEEIRFKFYEVKGNWEKLSLELINLFEESRSKLKQLNSLNGWPLNSFVELYNTAEPKGTRSVVPSKIKVETSPSWDFRSSSPENSSTQFISQTTQHHKKHTDEENRTKDGFQRLEHIILETNKTLLDEVSELRSPISMLVAENNYLKEQLKTMQTDNIRLSESVSLLKIEVDRLKDKENNLNNIIISGIPNRDRDPLIVTLRLMDTISANVTDYDIVSVRYFGKEPHVTSIRTTNPPQNSILVKLNSSRAKQEVIHKMKLFTNVFSDDLGFSNGESTNIFIRDHLTTRQLELFRATMKFKIENDFRFLWTSNNRILIRKAEGAPIHHIKSAADLEKLAK